MGFIGWFVIGVVVAASLLALRVWKLVGRQSQWAIEVFFAQAPSLNGATIERAMRVVSDEVPSSREANGAWLAMVGGREYLFDPRPIDETLEVPAAYRSAVSRSRQVLVLSAMSATRATAEEQATLARHLAQLAAHFAQEGAEVLARTKPVSAETTRGWALPEATTLAALKQGQLEVFSG